MLEKTLVENLGLYLASAAFLVGTIGLIVAALTYRKYQAQHQLLEFLGQQGSDLDDMVSKNRDMLKKESELNLDQARRIAWLEAKVRQTKPVVKEEITAVEEIPPPQILKDNITERRHRVLALYAKGHNPETIASTLGMMPGEVELMVKLNQTPLYI